MGVKALAKLDTVEVSLVKSGANRRRFAIFKTEDSMPLEEIIRAVLETETEGEDTALGAILKSDASPKARAAMQAILRAYNGFKDEMPKGVVNAAALAKALDMEPGEPTKKTEPKPAKKSETATEPTLKRGDLADLPPDIASKVEALWKANANKDKAIEALSLTVKAERDERRTREFTELARSDFDNLGEAAEVGAVLKSISDTDQELYGRVEAILKDAQARISEAPAFQEIGRRPGRAESLSGAESRMAAAVKEIVTKSGGKVDEPGAWEVIMRDKPELYDEYIAEKEGR